MNYKLLILFALIASVLLSGCVEKQHDVTSDDNLTLGNYSMRFSNNTDQIFIAANSSQDLRSIVFIKQDSETIIKITSENGEDYKDSKIIINRTYITKVDYVDDKMIIKINKRN